MSNQISLCKYSHAGPRELRHTRTGKVCGHAFAFGGWTWQAGGVTYRTDAFGGGLFRLQGDIWKKVEETHRFTLPADRTKAVRRLRRMGYDLA
jgi:hypothetical protein